VRVGRVVILYYFGNVRMGRPVFGDKRGAVGVKDTRVACMIVERLGIGGGVGLLGVGRSGHGGRCVAVDAVVDVVC